MWSRKLVKNKIYAVLLVLLGVVPILIEGDGTCFILFLLLGVTLFFSKENWIV